MIALLYRFLDFFVLNFKLLLYLSPEKYSIGEEIGLQFYKLFISFIRSSRDISLAFAVELFGLSDTGVGAAGTSSSSSSSISIPNGFSITKNFLLLKYGTIVTKND